MFTERFMQDVIEDYFGYQRTQRGRSDNTSAQQFGYNDLTIAAQRDIAPTIKELQEDDLAQLNGIQSRVS